MKRNRITERVYLRLLEQQETERLVREYVRDALYGESLLSEWDVAIAYAKNSLLSESANARGKMIVEGFLDKLADAASWAGQKVGGAWEKVKSAGGEAYEAASKAVMVAIEKIPGGKLAFEMIKEFSSDVADSVKETIDEGIEQFKTFIEESKDKIIEIVFSEGSGDAAGKIEELMKKAQGPGLEFLKKLKESPTEAVGEILSGGREVVAKIASVVAKVIMDTSAKVKASLQKFVAGAAFLKGKAGVLMIRLMTLLTSDMGGEKVIEAASKVWEAVKGLAKGGAKIGDALKEIMENMPDIVLGLLSGKSPIEGVLRAAIGDPSAASNLIKTAIQMTMKALGNVIGPVVPQILKGLKIEPDGKVGKVVYFGLSGLLGIELEAPEGGGEKSGEAKGKEKVPSKRRVV